MERVVFRAPSVAACRGGLVKTCPGMRRRAEVFNMGDVQWLTAIRESERYSSILPARGKDARDGPAEKVVVACADYSFKLLYLVSSPNIRQYQEKRGCYSIRAMQSHVSPKPSLIDL